MLQAPIFDGHSFDALSFGVDGFIPAEVSICWRHIAETFMITLVVIMLNERLDLGFEIAGKEVILEQDAVLQGLVPALYFALGLRMIRRAAHMLHLFVFQPHGQIAGDVAGTVIRQQPWFVQNLGLIAARGRESQFQRVSDIAGAHIGAELPG